jgi:formylglycine-generating enzyme required for sulfatase activity
MRLFPPVFVLIFVTVLLIGCSSDDGASPPVNNPILVCEPSDLSFGADTARKRVTVTVAGDDRDWTVEANESWLTVTPEDGDTSFEDNEFYVLVNRTWLTTGTFNGTVTVTSEDGEATTVPVTMTITDTEEYEPGAMAQIPAGRFLMGDGESWCGISKRTVTLTEDFLLGRYEVTNGEYADLLQWALDVHDPPLVFIDTTTVADSSGLYEPLLYMGNVHCQIYFEDGVFGVTPGNEDSPVVEVTWYGAVCYCDWKNISEGLAPGYDHDTWTCNDGDPYRAEGYRLPTDAEWEYATQAAGERLYPWGDERPTCDLAYFQTCGTGAAQTVGLTAPSPARYELFDMAGNAREWCHDWHDCNLGTMAAEDPVVGTAGLIPPWHRVMHGGAWNYEAHQLNCAYRYQFNPGIGSPSSGFRIARTQE